MTSRQSKPCPTPRAGRLEVAGAGQDRQLQTWLGKEQEDEIQQTLRVPGCSIEH